jgi:sodium/hydrogen antiporter
MSFLGWMGLAGALLLVVALSSAYIRRLPITTSTIYLLVGILVSPLAFNLITVDIVEGRVWFEHLTELAVIISLFIGGLKLRMPFRYPGWSAAFRLAGPVMIASIALVAVFAHYVIGLDWAYGFLLGALLAPTDPVLASTVSVNDAADRDRVRYGLSGEAGFNDGAAFPFVVFALLWIEYGRLGDWVAGWALHRLVWAVPAGLLLGFLLGKAVGMTAIWLRSKHRDMSSPNDFLALALIVLSYSGAEAIGAWGFLAAFAAGVGFRRAEVVTVESAPRVDSELAGYDHQEEHEDEEGVPHPPAEILAQAEHDEEALKDPVIAGGVVVSEIISFGYTAERLLEALTIVLVGICLALYWDWRALPLALALFFIIRPLAAMIFLIGTPTQRFQRGMMAWFGIRGIGSLYYLSYAMTHGLEEGREEMATLTITVVAASILIHGISSQPILDWYERKIVELEEKGAE